MTFSEFQRMRKKTTAAEMKLAGVKPNEQTQYGWLYPGGLLIESTEGWDYEFVGMYYLLVEGREYFTDDLEELERADRSDRRDVAARSDAVQRAALKSILGSGKGNLASKRWMSGWKRHSWA